MPDHDPTTPGRALLAAYRDERGPSPAAAERLLAALQRDLAAEHMSQATGPSEQVPGDSLAAALPLHRPTRRWLLPAAVLAAAANAAPTGSTARTSRHPSPTTSPRSASAPCPRADRVVITSSANPTSGPKTAAASLSAEHAATSTSARPWSSPGRLSARRRAASGVCAASRYVGGSSATRSSRAGQHAAARPNRSAGSNRRAASSPRTPHSRSASAVAVAAFSA